MSTPFSRRAFLKFTSGAAVMAGVASLPGCGDSQNFVFTDLNNGGGGSGPGPGPGPGPAPLILEQQLLEFGPDGTTYRLDQLGFTVARLDSAGEVVWEVGGFDENGPGLFNFPVALAVDSEGLIYVADRGNGEIEVLDSDGNLVRSFGDESLFIARDMALDAQRERLYVSDGPNHQVVIFDLVGNRLGSLGQFGTEEATDFNFPSGIAIGPAGEVHVVDSGNAEVQVYSADGGFLRAYGSAGAELGQFTIPRAIAVDATGNSWVADGVGGYVTQFNAQGVAVSRFIPTLPNGTPGQPTYLSLRPNGGLVITVVPGFQPA